MSTLIIPVLVTVLLRVPMFHLGFASLTFFLRPFDDPIVTWMLRGLFSTHFLAVGVGCGRGTAATAGRSVGCAGCTWAASPTTRCNAVQRVAVIGFIQVACFAART
jgi:hypothetical protein